jgi:hypothetical protein
MCWLNVLKFSAGKTDAHPIRLLTVTRTVASSEKLLFVNESKPAARKASTLTGM